jgi:hypothetical protein
MTPATTPAAPSQPRRNLEAIRPLLLDAARRIVSKESFVLRKKAKRPSLFEFKEFYMSHCLPIDEILEPVMIALWDNPATAQSQFEAIRFRHLYGRFNEVSEWFDEKPMIIEKHLDDWGELLPEELAEQWIKYFEEGT